MTRINSNGLGAPRSPVTGLPPLLRGPQPLPTRQAYLRSLPPAAQLALLRLTAIS